MSKIIAALAVASLAPSSRSPMHNTRPLDWKGWFRLLWKFVVVAVVGFGLIALETCHVVPLLVGKFGEALAISGVIGLVIELGTVARLIDHAGERIAHRLSAGHLPEHFRTQIADIIGATTVREGSVKRYRLSRATDGRLRVDVAQTHTVRNYAPRKSEYAPEIANEVFDHPVVVHISYMTHDGSGHNFSGDELGRYTVTHQGSRVVSVKGMPKVTLPPRSDERAHCVVSMAYNLTLPDEYSDVTAFSGPSNGLTIHLDGAPEDIDFFASDGEHVHHIAGSTMWHFDRTFLAGQHVRVWWFRKGTA